MKKVCSIHQPNFMPWLGYFSKIAQSDVFVILDNVEYQFGNSNSITNRTKIKTQSGELFFTIPIKKSDKKNINEQLIDWKQPWLKKQLKTIEMAYAKAPFKSEALNFFLPLLQNQTEYLSEYNSNIIIECCKLLNLNTEIHVASKLPDFSTDKNLRLVEMCKYFNCNTYLSGNGAKKYNDVDLYQQHHVELEYTQFQHPNYQQLHGDFIPGLSILDVMMNVGVRELNEIF